MTYAQGRAALARTELFGPIIAQVGRCALKPEKREPYEALVRAIAHQQVHGRAAEAMLGRLIALHPADGFPPPTALLDAGAEKLRGCGFSVAKCASILDIAEKSAAGWVPTRRAAMRLPDDELAERLVALRGVGRWTVEMLLIFSLGRLDVLPVDDFGVREGYRMAMGLEAQPKPKELAAIGAEWAPFRSVAAWYLWRQVDLVRKMKMVAP